MRNKYNKPITLHCCSAGNRCSLPLAVCIMLACLLLVELYSLLPHKDAFSFDTQLDTSNHLRELEEVDEFNIHMPPPRKRSARAIKRKPKKATTIVEEFLDETSQIRHLFFPKTAIDPNKGNDSYYYPGSIWLDTEGNPIQAHGGGILYDERSKTYYWYGEYKDGPTYHAHKKAAARVINEVLCENVCNFINIKKQGAYFFASDSSRISSTSCHGAKEDYWQKYRSVPNKLGVDIIGVGCYSSKDLWTWKNEGIVLAAEEDESHDLHKSNVLERPKVLYNEETGKYVMWMHIDDVNYTKASVGVAVSEYPNGPFEYLYSKNPHGFDSRDMTVFRDSDGTAYLIYSSVENSELHVSPLTKDYLDVTNVLRPILIGHHREAPAVFKHKGTYYMITSGCSGWSPNEAMVHASESMMGPWETMGNPCLGGNRIARATTFFSQSTFVLPLKGLPDYYIFMADRWNPADLRDSRYFWLPLKVAGPADQPLDYDFGFPLWPRVSIFWHKKWRLPYRWGV